MEIRESNIDVGPQADVDEEDYLTPRISKNFRKVKKAREQKEMESKESIEHSRQLDRGGHRNTGTNRQQERQEAKKFGTK